MAENSTITNFTRLLKQAEAGNRQTLDEFLPLVYDELKRIASYKLSLERANHTLQATALVHEAYLRLIDQHSVNWQDRAHFFGIASEMMRRILVNYAESRNAKKRNEGKTLIALDEIEEFVAETEVDLIFLDDALNELAEFDRTQAKIVELKFFGGLTNEEAAEVLGVSASTVKREWRMAKSWLTTRLT
ncbi:MAG: sigma-70 family RNA polymerase sigma factor [Pyrinomonadaceae bacterium]